MVYISNGQVLDNRNQSPWRLSFITDFFWGIAEFVVLFVFLPRFVFGHIKYIFNATEFLFF
ncbi:Selenok [Phodopus roborovskii]|uniref:Selenoprotein K n=1 Tax=Phodopus roborovskii TaxID=109678 RepID=A0AAV0A7L0_PHORO|nr:Selenok [Phodopus roborovskii]